MIPGAPRGFRMRGSWCTKRRFRIEHYDSNGMLGYANIKTEG